MTELQSARKGIVTELTPSSGSTLLLLNNHFLTHERTPPLRMKGYLSCV